MSTLAFIETASSNVWAGHANARLDDLVLRTSAPSQQTIIACNSNVGITLSNNVTTVRDTLNVTSQLQIGGANANTLYAPLATSNVAWAASNQAFANPNGGFAIVREQHPLGTVALAFNGGNAMFMGTWYAKPLNTIHTNIGNNVAALNGTNPTQIWLRAGTYDASLSVYITFSAGMRGRLQNITTSTTMVEMINATTVGIPLQFGQGVFTISGSSNALEWQFMSPTAHPNVNQAGPVSAGSEIYGQITFRRLS
jgi:hypothetical protein